VDQVCHKRVCLYPDQLRKISFNQSPENAGWWCAIMKARGNAGVLAFSGGMVILIMLTGCTAPILSKTRSGFEEGALEALLPDRPVVWNVSDPLQEFARSFWNETQTRFQKIPPTEGANPGRTHGVAGQFYSTQARIEASFKLGFYSPSLGEMWWPRTLIEKQIISHDLSTADEYSRVLQENNLSQVHLSVDAIEQARANQTSTTLPVVELAERFFRTAMIHAADLPGYLERASESKNPLPRYDNALTAAFGARTAVRISEGAAHSVVAPSGAEPKPTLPSPAEVEVVLQRAENISLQFPPAGNDGAEEFARNMGANIKTAREWLSRNWTEGAWFQAKRALVNALTQRDFVEGRLPPKVNISDMERLAREDPRLALQCQGVAVSLWVAQEGGGLDGVVYAGEMAEQLKHWWDPVDASILE
jgi:hypothetical protein